MAGVEPLEDDELVDGLLADEEDEPESELLDGELELLESDDDFESEDDFESADFDSDDDELDSPFFAELLLELDFEVDSRLSLR